MSLRSLLLGPPLVLRNDEQEVARYRANIRNCVAAVRRLLEQVYGKEGTAAKQAAFELDCGMKDVPNDEKATTDKHLAFLLFAMTEPEIATGLSAFEASSSRKRRRGGHEESAGLGALDMQRRVLPFVRPRFLKNNCQRPDRFVMTCVVLGEMYKNERLGNWPLEKAGGEGGGAERTHHDFAVDVLGHRSDRKGGAASARGVHGD